MNIDIIKSEIKSPALREIASAIVSAVSGVEGGQMPLDQGRLRISGCKHVLQIMALEMMKDKQLRPNEVLPILPEAG